ncbi:hypothetical protein BpHYR1_019815 [Brachionus plicatilis]|uniref:Uncharacterized protein n=1 Tax=Brachionus plicatilis TaxID=10195 RepID=A0A3M7RXN9_BRAPC|nr:hypothetical protein BpHYR1_019815 [Brachionus plicatilis]
MRVTGGYLIVVDVVRANRCIWREVFCGHFLTVVLKPRIINIVKNTVNFLVNDTFFVPKFTNLEN